MRPFGMKLLIQIWPYKPLTLNLTNLALTTRESLPTTSIYISWRTTFEFGLPLELETRLNQPPSAAKILIEGTKTKIPMYQGLTDTHLVCSGPSIALMMEGNPRRL